MTRHSFIRARWEPRHRCGPPPKPQWRRVTSSSIGAYSRTRKAFGRPIGTFQTLAHAMADLQTEIDSARLLAYRAAWCSPGTGSAPRAS
ncbi:MAG TPA: acyl-CoA dehydrogenase family protein [Pseudonocardia sp.]